MVRAAHRPGTAYGLTNSTGPAPQSAFVPWDCAAPTAAITAAITCDAGAPNASNRVEPDASTTTRKPSPSSDERQASVHDVLDRRRNCPCRTSPSRPGCWMQWRRAGVCPAIWSGCVIASSLHFRRMAFAQGAYEHCTQQVRAPELVTYFTVTFASWMESAPSRSARNARTRATSRGAGIRLHVAMALRACGGPDAVSPAMAPRPSASACSVG